MEEITFEKLRIGEDSVGRRSHGYLLGARSTEETIRRNVVGMLKIPEIRTTM